MLQLLPQWLVASNTLLTLCTIGLQEDCHPNVIVPVAFNALLEWTATIALKKLNPVMSSIMFHLPYPVKAVENVFKVMEFLGSARLVKAAQISIHMADVQFGTHIVK